MTQKDKVKELVGRGLHSYHTKALQQMDKIEKKNKEQNHKISILTNELDNDYLTKTEEGSVISLEHSKEGMVYLDELQGNTLVNYCTDGSKEITLNGDIDLEGTFVTTTEGVNNGKVDVMCEGNTLVNLSETKEKLNQTNPHYGDVYLCEIEKIKPNTTYTLSYDFECNINFPIERCYLGYAHGKSSMRVESSIIFNPVIGKNKLVFTIPSTEWENAKNNGDINFLVRVFIDNNKLEKTYSSKNVLLLEGDWSNKEIPKYFKGMKSVGQDDENGHKIEILSQNKNLFNINETDVYSSGTRCEKNGNSLRIIPTSTPSWASYNIKIKGFKNGETYTLSCISDNYHLPKSRIALYERATNTNVGSWDRNYFTIPNNVNVEDIYLRIHCCDQDATNIREVEISDVLIEKGQAKTQFIPYVMNKKEILLNEPLVGNDAVKDRVVKIGGKYFIERFWRTVTLDGTQELIKGGWEVPIFTYYVPNTEGEPTNFPNTLICDRITPKSFNLNDDTHWALYTGKDSVETKRYIRMQIPASIVSKDDLEGFKTWLRNNPITIAYRLNIPIYEPLEIEPTLNSYNDITHIYNNSIIPCNMKIQNSGYNAIIKPSTLYTVALDTNKSGTIGVNLGGAKVTTTNNVATITTPATLTDDSLRLYGKGIKGSKVRLLEGDKTNWIPSYFEGMKSSFEDKFDDTDNTYKMEILSEGKNKLNGYIFARSIFNSVKNSVLDTENKTIKYNASDIDNVILKSIKFKKNTRYTIILKGFNSNEDMQSTNIKVIYTDGSSQPINNFIDGISVVVTFEGKTVSHLIGNWSTLTTTLYYDECGIFEGVNVPFEPYKYHNKIQFSSIDPLRKWDRFVFKDGRLMIERYSGELILEPNARYWNRKVTYPKPNVSRLEANGIFDFDLENIFDWSHRFYVLSNNFIFKEGENKPNYIALLGETNNGQIRITLNGELSFEECMTWLAENTSSIIYRLKEPTYEEVPFELQKIILEGYENGTLFLDTNIPPTVKTTYAGETPIVKATKLNKTEVLNNTEDINDNIIPYLMDMDYRVVKLQLATEEIEGEVFMVRLFGRTYEMIKRDILSKRYSIDEYRHRLDAYLGANKITEEEYNKLGDMLNE